MTGAQYGSIGKAIRGWRPRSRNMNDYLTANTVAPHVWAFESSGEAYNTIMYTDEIKVGDTIIIRSEQIIGLAWAWPLAVSSEYGNFHTLIDKWNMGDLPFMTSHRERALYWCIMLGYAVDPCWL